jgi:hypothetical protein
LFTGSNTSVDLLERLSTYKSGDEGNDRVGPSKGTF